LKPGGRLVYSTCSLEREENEDVVEGLTVTATQLRIPGRDQGDGFFAALITKTILAADARRFTRIKTL
jgi:16S rRNA (cytosine967-C5)-methyltransferase